ncbi:uncharacterized protein LOC128558412 [Mercenaria mercenaria]|uniref:uncharacterized protein LOC128558412 n=1 Tax=Mercenaria mercenaria TaxID=6596 RepID=UPI00234F780F|nr:uncharacterized protein LOC128558412 [Mercenaria mercenaria]XP_053403420.1 uncharacterized protein LOC128558412 [Mercenaria mercenaria]
MAFDLTDLTDESTEEEFLGTEVTTSHYVPKSARKKCQNESCETLFLHPGLKRPHHCRRCGKIFCMSCLQYKRRLNIVAQPDPNGVLCKVCLSCFEDRGLSLGCTSRSQTEVFKQLHKQTKEDMMDIVYGYAVESRRVSVQPTFWKE